MACAGMSGVTTGLREQKEQGPIDVLFLCDEWKSTKGGLTTFNRELAINFAKATTGSMKIHCYVSKSDDQDRENARRHSVNLITAKRLPGIDDPLDWLKIPPSELPHPDIVIGHGRKFGAPAFFIVQATKCKWLQFVHVFCEDIGKYKAATTDGTDVIEENEKKHKREIELCKAAHVFVAVGRRLQRKYSRSLLDVEVEIITPGTFENFASETRLVSDKSVFKVLLVGRANFEDLTLKGYDIIADAIGILGKAFELTFVGASTGEYKKIQEWFLNKSRIDLNQLTIRGYSCAQDDIKSNLHQSDLVTLPSRTDGFGLVALEAISAGIPILVASECGIAEALREVEKGKSAIVEPDRHVEQWVERIRQLASQSPEKRQTNATLLRENYQKKYPWQTQCNRFKGMIQQALETTNVLDVTVDVDNMETRKGDMQNTGTASSKVELSEYHRSPQPGANVMPTGGAKPPGTEDGRLINDTSTEKVLHEIALRYLKILDRLWDHYLSGYLGKMVQDCFVTEDILQELNLVKLKLKTTMEEEEYKICRVYLEKHSFRGAGGSLKSHSLGFTSRDPIKQEVGDVKTGMEQSYLIMKEESGQQKETHERKFRGGMEAEKIRMKISKQIERDKYQEQKQHEKVKLAGNQSRPSFDVVVAMEALRSKRVTSEKQVKLKEAIGSGARPKERKRKERSKKTKVKEAYVNDTVIENLRTSYKKSSSKQPYSFTLARGFSRDYGETFVKQEVLQENLLPLLDDKGVQAKSDSSDGGEIAGALVETDPGWTVVTPRGQNGRPPIQTKFRSVGLDNKAQEWRKLESHWKSARDWSSLPRSNEISRRSTLPSKHNSETGGERFANETSVGIGLQSTKALPNSVFSICNHFLQENRRRGNYKHPTPCSKCSKDSSKLLFGVWRSFKKEWQIMRPYPKRLNLKTPFRLCWHFSNGRNCPKSPCSFAHGQEELEFWTVERELESGTFSKIDTDGRPRQEVEPENFPKPQELIKGSLVFRHTAEKKLRPPEKSANPGEVERRSSMGCKSGEIPTTRKEEHNEPHTESRLSNWQRLDPKLNESQREVIKRILAPEDLSSPLMVFGPFGTGKTFTLNQAVRELVTREGNRVLLCTHTNRAADIHVKLSHKYLTEQNGLKATRPLRIYQTKRRLNADLEIAKRYGLIRNGAYVLPTREDMILHRVVITTLAVSRHLLELRINNGFFTHILIDEAYQAPEPEALTPLALAGPNTKVVFTGDHMQMGANLEEQLCNPVAAEWPSLENNLSEETYKAPLVGHWVVHCVIRRAAFSKENTLLVVEMDFHQSASKFPDELLNGGQLSTVTIIHRSLPN
ncbi:putative helicase with zinc finger domain, partial [Stylophora pistillata]